ncbi:MAG: hypothetical protein AB7F40_10130 [Victivallaceae bacterium]|nr:hypothetical protein [Victivallaceae bacterium]
MHCYHYWDKVAGALHTGYGDQMIEVFGGSDESMSGARQDALDKIAAIQHRIDAGINGGTEDSEYTVPIREEIVRELSPRSIITRNRYGAEVLNSEELLFLDVDFNSAAPPQPGLLKRLFGARKMTNEDIRNAVTLRTLDLSTSKFPSSACVRVYRTRAGLRVLAGNLEPDWLSDEFMKLMQEFRADLLYAILCRRQRCSRARLTPKPYRVGQPPLRHEFPYPEESREIYEQWRDSYNEKSRKYAVCHLLHCCGSKPVEPWKSLMEFHDEATRAESNLSLA